MKFCVGSGVLAEGVDSACSLTDYTGSCITGVRANEVCDLDTFARQCNGIRHTNCSTSDMGGEGTSEPGKS